MSMQEKSISSSACTFSALRSLAFSSRCWHIRLNIEAHIINSTNPFRWNDPNPIAATYINAQYINIGDAFPLPIVQNWQPVCNANSYPRDWDRKSWILQNLLTFSMYSLFVVLGLTTQAKYCSMKTMISMIRTLHNKKRTFKPMKRENTLIYLFFLPGSIVTDAFLLVVHHFKSQTIFGFYRSEIERRLT